MSSPNSSEVSIVPNNIIFDQSRRLIYRFKG
jgi:hypothetical protein